MTGFSKLVKYGFPARPVGPPRDGLNPTEHGRNLATPAGFEPATPSLEGWCSIRLSYGVLPGARFTRAAGLLKGARLGNLHGPEALAISAIADDADRARQGLGALWASKTIEQAMPMPRLPGFS